MEQCRMNSQQLNRNSHDAASLNILQSPFYPSFPELLDGSKVTQAPHSLPSYVQQQYAPDSGASLEGGGSPLPYHILERPPGQQGHLHLHPSPLPQQHQPYPTVAYPLFSHDHEGPYPTPQGLSQQLSRASELSVRMPISPRPIDSFSDKASTQPTILRGGIPLIYDPPNALRPQPPYHPSPTHRSVSTHHAPLEQSQPTTTPGPSILHGQHKDREITVQGQRSRSWDGVGSLDPATGAYSQALDHSRIRTVQACDKCRERKAKCSGERPTCQRCLERRLECNYAAERRMRGPNKPKPLPLSMPDGSSQPAVTEGQKLRKRASTMPTVQGRLQIRGQQRQQQKQKQGQRLQEHAAVAAAAASAAAASPASSAGSGSLGYPPLSESESSPMTPHSSLDSRHSTCVSFPASPQIDFFANTRPGVLSHVSEGNRYGQGGDHDGVVATEDLVAGVDTYGQDVFPDLSFTFENPKTF